MGEYQGMFLGAHGSRAVEPPDMGSHSKQGESRHLTIGRMVSLSEFCKTAVARDAMGGNLGRLVTGYFAIVAGLKAAKREADLSGVVANESPPAPLVDAFHPTQHDIPARRPGRGPDMNPNRLDKQEEAEDTWSSERQQAFAWREIYERKDATSIVQQHRLTTALRWIDFLRFPNGVAALDAGCGAGMMSIELARRGAMVTAVDVSLPMLVAARDWSREEGWLYRTHIGAADIHALPFRDRSFGLVVALGVVPWARRPRASLAELHRVLEPGGYLVVSAANRRSLRRLLDPHPLRNPVLAPIRRLACALVPRVREKVAKGERVTEHTPAEFDHLLRSVGLQRAEGQTYGYGPFTLLQREFLSEQTSVRMHRTLQRLADRRMIPGLHSLGNQYLVLCRRRP